MRCCSSPVRATPTSIYGLWMKGGEWMECNNDPPLQTPSGKSNNRVGHIGHIPHPAANSMIRIGASFHEGDSVLPPGESGPGPVQGCWFFILFLFVTNFYLFRDRSDFWNGLAECIIRVSGSGEKERLIDYSDFIIVHFFIYFVAWEVLRRISEGQKISLSKSCVFL